MRSAKAIVKEYRKKGYSDEQLRALAASREEPLRLQILAEIEMADSVARKKPGKRQVGVLLETEKIEAAMLPGMGVALPGMSEDLPCLFAAPSASESAVHSEGVASAESEADAEFCEEVLVELEQEMAEKSGQIMTLVIEECIEFRIDSSDITETEEVEVELESGKADDILESAELILSAYQRAGEDVSDYLENATNYVAPVLTVIECEHAPKSEDDGILHLQPDYALTPQQREAAEERALDEHYHATTQAIQADFARLARERQSEEPQLPCEDFDALARPAEEGWAPEPVLVTVEDDAADLASASMELARLRGWLYELEDGLKMRTLEQSRLQTDLNERDETVVVMGRQLAAVEEVNAAVAEQSRHDSEVIARTQNVLTEQRARLDDLHAENEHLSDDIRLAQGYLENNNAIISAQSTEVLQLRHQLEDLNVGAGKLVEHNQQMEVMLAGREREAAALRSELQEQALRLEELAGREQELLRGKERLEQLQLEYNILTSETLPGLQADKEELVELIGEENSHCIQLQTIAAQRARRSSYSVAVAAAACLLMVLTPAFSWHSREIDRMNTEEAYNSRIAQAESVQHALRAERTDLNNRLQAVRAQYSQEREEWSAKFAALTEGGNGVLDSQKLGVKTCDGTFDPQLFDMPPVTGKEGNPDRTHYNDVTNLVRFLAKQDARKTRDSESRPDDSSKLVELPVKPDLVKVDAYKTVQVRRGEGLSQVLWRVYGNSSPEMIRHITKLNNLATDKRGNPALQLDQQLKLPVDPRTAMLTD